MNICPCCKTSHDSTACPTPSAEGLGAMNCSAENLQRRWNDISVELALRNLEEVSTATLYAIGMKDISDRVQKARYELRKYKQNIQDQESPQ